MYRLATISLLSLGLPLSLLAAPEIKLVPAYKNVEMERPVSVQIPDDGTGRHFLVEQTGKI